MGVVWLASYPKSGNTWVRFLLVNYLVGPITASAEVDHAIPGVDPNADIDAILARRDPAYIKTHFPWSADHPFAAQTDRAIVVVRNPKDVLLSNLNYQRLIGGTERDFSDYEYASSFINVGGDPIWLKRHGYGTLDGHAQGWLDNPEAPPCILVRYEDLKARTAAELRRIIEFVGLPLDEERLAFAEAESTFDRMRALEIREKAARRKTDVFPGSAPLPGKRPRFFMNAGRSGGTLDRISPGLDAAFDQRFAALCARLGYAKAG